MQNPNGYAFQAKTVTGTTPIPSGAICSKQWVYASFQAIFSSDTIGGTLQIQFSNDVPVGNPYGFSPTNWTNVPGAVATASVSSGTSAVVYVPNGFVAQNYQVVFTPSAGAGTATCTYNALFA